MRKWTILLTTLLIGLIASRAGATSTYWEVASGDWSTDSSWSNGEPTGEAYAYINNAGTAHVTQLGEVCNVLYLGQDVGQSGSASLSEAGQLSAGAEYIGYYGTGTFTQISGTNTIS